MLWDCFLPALILTIQTTCTSYIPLMPAPETSDLTGYKIRFQENQINLAILGKKWTHLNLTLQDSSGLTYNCSDANHIIWRKRASTHRTATWTQDNIAEKDTPSKKPQPHQNHGTSNPSVLRGQETDVRSGWHQANSKSRKGQNGEELAKNQRMEVS